MSLKVSYDWTVEEIDQHGDIIDSQFFETFDSAFREFNASNMHGETDHKDIGLVRYLGDEYEGVVEREYAYIKDGVLPEVMDGGSKVPQKFHKEYLKATASGWTLENLATLYGRQNNE